MAGVITWGWLKDWARQNGVTDDSVVMDFDGRVITDLSTDGENGRVTLDLVLEFGDPADEQEAGSNDH